VILCIDSLIYNIALPCSLQRGESERIFVEVVVLTSAAPIISSFFATNISFGSKRLLCLVLDPCQKQVHYKVSKQRTREVIKESLDSRICTINPGPLGIVRKKN